MRIIEMRKIALVLAAVGALTAPVAAQTPAAPKPPGGTPVEAQAAQGQVLVLQDDSAGETRTRLQELLRQYPPSLSTVLRLDPSLLTTALYLAPYPALAAFLAQHPEIARNPSFFLGPPTYGYDRDESPERYRSRVAESMITSMIVLTGLMTLLGVVAWLIKSAIDHRRWLRQSKVQNEAHNKLFDRLTANEDLLAYIQTPVGRRFLESAPLQAEGYAALPGAPVTRILWSVQAGAVASMIGLGFLFVSSRFSSDTTGFAEASPAVFLVGCVITAAGIGFVLSAVAAFVLSKRLGLLPAPESSHA
jgi:hypothetical protein